MYDVKILFDCSSFQQILHRFTWFIDIFSTDVAKPMVFQTVFIRFVDKRNSPTEKATIILATVQQIENESTFKRQ